MVPVEYFRVVIAGKLDHLEKIRLQELELVFRCNMQKCRHPISVRFVAGEVLVQDAKCICDSVLRVTADSKLERMTVYGDFKPKAYLVVDDDVKYIGSLFGVDLPFTTVGGKWKMPMNAFLKALPGQLEFTKSGEGIEGGSESSGDECEFVPDGGSHIIKTLEKKGATRVIDMKVLCPDLSLVRVNLVSSLDPVSCGEAASNDYERVSSQGSAVFIKDGSESGRSDSLTGKSVQGKGVVGGSGSAIEQGGPSAVKGSFGSESPESESPKGMGLIDSGKSDSVVKVASAFEKGGSSAEKGAWSSESSESESIKGKELIDLESNETAAAMPHGSLVSQLGKLSLNKEDGVSAAVSHCSSEGYTGDGESESGIERLNVLLKGYSGGGVGQSSSGLGGGSVATEGGISSAGSAVSMDISPAQSSQANPGSVVSMDISSVATTQGSAVSMDISVVNEAEEREMSGVSAGSMSSVGVSADEEEVNGFGEALQFAGAGVGSGQP